MSPSRPDAPLFRSFLLALAIVLSLALGACTLPAATSPSPGADVASTQIDRSCRSDADCAVKNVGNCCGYYPSCVNVDSPTDPEGVRAACAESGTAAVCGFPAISSCQCVSNRCEGSNEVTPG